MKNPAKIKENERGAGSQAVREYNYFMDKEVRRKLVLSFLALGLLVCLSMFIAACAAATPTNTPVPPTRTRLPATPTPRKPTVTPTATQTRTPLPTLIPTRTATSTIDVAATANAFFLANAAVSNAEIKKELTALGLPTAGNLAWYSFDPAELLLKNYNQTVLSGAAKNLEFDNFILKFEITWNSRSGLAGCGVIFRSAAPLATGAQYQFTVVRISGAPAWDLEYWDKGTSISHLFGAVQYDKAINVDQGATNVYYIMANGKNLEIYANQKKLGSVSDTRLAKGMLGWFGIQESGETSCVFNRAWVWELPSH